MTTGVVARAPGRVNLIGEHTDYNGGYVLPTVLPRETVVEIERREDDVVTIFSTAISSAEPTRYRLGDEKPVGDWTDYVRGVTQALGRRQALGGFHARIESTVPVGRGLASSAALTVAVQRALRERFSLGLDDLDLAHIAQGVENDFVGARVGIMDPLAASVGRAGEALFVDTRDLTIRRVPIPAGVELVVIDSGSAHRHATGEYNRRRAECEEAAERLGVQQLRDLTEADLHRISALPDTLARRARHVVTENARVLEAVAALETEDIERLGSLLSETHRSLRDDFQVSTAGVDALVERLRSQNGVLGARITGGGFGGAVLAVAMEGTGQAAADGALDGRRGHHEVVIFAPGGTTARSASRNGARPKPLGDVLFGGFECSTHLLRSGRRLDLISSTRHDELARRDYRRLRDLGIHTARDGVRWTLVEPTPGRYDLASARPMVGAALEAGVRVIWDLLHFGWPDHVDPMDRNFPERFGEYAGRFADLLREEGDEAPAVCPVNEISFLSFAGGEAGFFNPFLHARGDDLKAQLVRASTAACKRVRSALPHARLIHVDPVIHVVARPDRPQDVEAAENHRQAQFHAWDMIAGRRHAELGGRPEYLDVIGVNYYVHNQWYYPGGHGSMIGPSSPRARPLHQLLLEVHRRYGRPLFIAETGIEDEARWSSGCCPIRSNSCSSSASPTPIR
jgi:galactokinase